MSFSYDEDVHYDAALEKGAMEPVEESYIFHFIPAIYHSLGNHSKIIPAQT